MGRAMKRNASRKRKRLRRWLLGFGIGLAVLIASLYLAVSYRPAWYEPPAIPPEQYQVLRDEVTTLLSSVGNNLHEGKPFRIILTDKQINRWLAGRRHLWPTLERLVPPDLADPAVRFEPGRIILAARYESAALRCLLRIALTARIDEADHTIVLRLEGAKVGIIGVPKRLLKRLLEQSIRRIKWLSLLNQLDITELRLPSQMVWPNGQFRFRIRGIRLEPGRMEIAVLPLPRQNKGRRPSGGS